MRLRATHFVDIGDIYDQSGAGMLPCIGAPQNRTPKNGTALIAFTVLTLTTLASLPCADATDTIVIPCHELYNTLAGVTRLRTGSVQWGHRADCNMQLVQLFHNFMLRDGAQGTNATRFEGANLVLPVAYLDEARMRTWLVWAFLGKHFVAQDTNRQTAFFEYDEVAGINTVNGSLTRVLAACEFQQPLYLTLIVILIVILVAVLVWPLLEEMRSANKGHTVPVQMGGGHAHYVAPQPSALETASLRFRVPASSS